MTRRVCQTRIPKYLPVIASAAFISVTYLLFAGGAVRSVSARGVVRLIAWAVGS